jgi:hypothetical protein
VYLSGHDGNGLVQQIGKAEGDKCSLHVLAKAGVNECAPVAVLDVPCVDGAQFGGELFRGLGGLDRYDTFAVRNDHQPRRTAPCAEVRGILRCIDLGESVGV